MEDVLVQTLAERIVDYAQACMSNRKRVSPFERAAAREGQYFRGGVSRVHIPPIGYLADVIVVLQKTDE